MVHDAPRDSRRTRATATTYVALGVFQRSSSLLLLPFVSRVLSPSQFGTIAALTLTLSLVNVVLAGPLEPAVFRATVRPEAELGGSLAAIRNYLLFALPAGCITVAVALWLLGGRDWHSTPTLWAVELCSCGLLAGYASFGLPMIRALDLLSTFVVASTSWIITLIGLKFLFVGWLSLGSLGWVLADLAASLLGWVIIVVALPRRTRSLMAVSSRSAARRVLRFSAPLLPHRIAFWALASLSRPALALVASANDVGIFALAISISGAAVMLLGEVNNAVLLEYSREEVPGPTPVTLGIARGQVILASVVPALLGIGLALAGGLLIGSAYDRSVQLVGFLLLGQTAYGLYVVPMNYLVQTAGRTRLSSTASVSGAAVTFASVLVSGLADRLWVAAVGTSAGYAVMCAVALWLARREMVVTDLGRLAPRGLLAVVWAVTPVLSLATLFTAGTTRWALVAGAALGVCVLTGAWISSGPAVVRRSSSPVGHE